MQPGTWNWKIRDFDRCFIFLGFWIEANNPWVSCPCVPVSTCKSLGQGLSSAELHASSHKVTRRAKQICPACGSTRKLQQCHEDTEGYLGFTQTPRDWTSTWHLYLLCLVCSSQFIWVPAGLGRDSRKGYQGDGGTQTLSDGNVGWMAAATTEAPASLLVPPTAWKRKADCLCFQRLHFGKSQFCTKTEHAHQLVMAKAGGNKHWFFSLN